MRCHSAVGTVDPARLVGGRRAGLQLHHLPGERACPPGIYSTECDGDSSSGRMYSDLILAAAHCFFW